MLVQDFLKQSAKAHPDKVALIRGDQRITYAQVQKASLQLANFLKENGIQRGERVAIYLQNSIEAVISIFGTLKADAVFVFLNRNTKPEKVISLMQDCAASALITDVRAAGQGLVERAFSEVQTLKTAALTGAKNPVQQNGYARVHTFASIQQTAKATEPLTKNIDLDLACLIYTSGTTGESKGVMCDHSNVVFVTQAIVSYLKNTDRDTIMNVLPLAFSYGLYQLMAMMCVGGTLVLEDSFAFPDMVLEKMAHERVTGFAGVPTIYSMLLGMDLGKYDLASLRYLTNAAAGLPVEHVKRLHQTFPKTEIFLMHGLTEVARTMYLPPEQIDARPDSSGIAMPGTELWIEDENGQRLGPGEVGELVTRGRHVMRGYWQARELTAARFRSGALPGERVCHTGDLFKTDAEGYFYFVSRKDDIIKSRGEKVAPREVENVLYALRGVQDAAVIGVPDPLFGQVVKAFIVTDGISLTETDVIAHCKSRLEEYMVPRHVEFRADLPKTGSGKIRKVELR